MKAEKNNKRRPFRFPKFYIDARHRTRFRLDWQNTTVYLLILVISGILTYEIIQFIKYLAYHGF